MLGALKIFMLLLACLGLAHIIGNGDRTKTVLAFFCVAFLVWHLETKIERSKVTVTVDGRTVVRNGQIVQP